MCGQLSGNCDITVLRHAGERNARRNRLLLQADVEAGSTKSIGIGTSQIANAYFVHNNSIFVKYDNPSH